jgi:O-antigen/teichoic acid export membrane protein
MVTGLLDAAAAGPYNAAADLASQIGGVIGLSLYSVASPNIIKTFATGGIADARAEFRRAGEMFLAVALPATVGVILVADPLVSIVAGVAFHELMVKLLPLMIIAVGISSLNQHHLHIAFQVMSKPGLQVVAGLVQVLCLVALSYVFIGWAGAVGAAYALIAASLIGSVTTVVLARSVFPVSLPMMATAKIAVCTAGMSAMAYLCIQMFAGNFARLATAMASGAATYAVLALWFDVCGARNRFRVLIGRLRTAVL